MNTLYILLGAFGPWQFALIAVVVLLLFGGRKIPELMKGIGGGLKEFKKATKEDDDDKNEKNEKKEDKK